MKDDDFSLVTRTLASLLTEQHRFSDVSKRHGELIRQQGELMQEQIAFSEGQEGRLKELMGSFADGTTDLRQRMANLEKRVDGLEEAG